MSRPDDVERNAANAPAATSAARIDATGPSTAIFGRTSTTESVSEVR